MSQTSSSKKAYSTGETGEEERRAKAYFEHFEHMKEGASVD